MVTEYSSNNTGSSTLPTRRDILRSWLAVGIGGAGAVLPSHFDFAQAQALPPTPRCDDGPTAAVTEGPYFSPNSPRKSDFRADARGEPFMLVGFVVDRRCRPLPGAVVDIWHADSAGEYDNAGFRLRGHQLSDPSGRYLFETIVPGGYQRRTPHYHVKVAPPGRRVLTTQLYFPDEARNAADFLFNRRLVMTVRDAADGKVGRFDFVLDV